MRVETQYPHQGRIRPNIAGEKPRRFALRLRGPAARGRGPQLRPDRARVKEPGDRVILDLDMPARIVLPRPDENENAGQAVPARGPLVYCLEQVDSKFPIAQARLNLRPEDAARRVKARWRPNLLDGVYVLEAPGVAGPLALVPFCARACRAEDNRWLTFPPPNSQRYAASRPRGAAHSPRGSRLFPGLEHFRFLFHLVGRQPPVPARAR